MEGAWQGRGGGSMGEEGGRDNLIDCEIEKVKKNLKNFLIPRGIDMNAFPRHVWQDL